MSGPPWTFETPRLRLEPLTADYADRLAGLYQGPGIARFLGGDRLTDEVAARQARRFDEVWKERGFGQSAVHERVTGAFVGRVGLHPWEEWGELELGWVIAPSHQRRGFATEAASAWLAWARANPPADHLIAVIHPDNRPSIRTAEGLGFAFDREDRTSWSEAVIYRLDLPAARIGPVLRPAVAGDVERVAEIWSTGWREVHLDAVPDALVAARSPGSFAERAAGRIADTTVVEDAGLVVGFVMALDDEVDQLYVARTHRGAGSAGRLLAAAERMIRERGHGSAWLAVVPTNTRARRFYERQGWRDDGWFEHAAPGPDGPITVPCHRYTKDLGRVRQESATGPEADEDEV